MQPDTRSASNAPTPPPPASWLGRLRALFTQYRPPKSAPADFTLAPEYLAWVMGGFCAIHRKPFDPGLLLQQLAPPYRADTLVHAARSLEFRIRRRDAASPHPGHLQLPGLVLLHPNIEAEAPATPASDEQATTPLQDAAEDPGNATQANTKAQQPPKLQPAIVTEVHPDRIVFFEAGRNTPQTLNPEAWAARQAGIAFELAVQPTGAQDPDAVASTARRFGFAWFLTELLRHKRIWRDVLLASLVIQLLALGTPLFTQVIIDKVVVHRTHSTLLVIGIGLGVFLVFSAVLSWVRQYLVLHTGNRVDAVLGAAVFEHLLKLPARYFEHRPTGVIAARLHGVETIREFIASAAVTVLLDLPFLTLFLLMMAYYSLTLTLIVITIITIIAGLSLLVAPLLRRRLNEQFLLGARNQAFTTEHVAGIDTVKSLQMEPQLNARYSDYLADYLRSGFTVRQLGNSYHTLSNTLEQLMTMLILVVGAYTVMHSAAPGSGGAVFTIGMLVAFQMYAARVSQPLLRLVGLWQQFQQANLSVQRLGDIMNAPAEPYAVTPQRLRTGRGEIRIEQLSFKYGKDRPLLFEDFNLQLDAGRMVAIMGPSGSGKSTLARLLLGFYQPTAGSIKIDGTDIRHLTANELRHHFGVVPQETVLFSGTVYDNLLLANPHASFEQIVRACRMAEIHTAIAQLPQGYQTEIGERGAGLSGGQKQRLAIARALLKQPRILIFDEATSSLDKLTAEHFAATINQLKGKVSMIFIAHALPRNLQVDEVVRIGSALRGVGSSAATTHAAAENARKGEAPKRDG